MISSILVLALGTVSPAHADSAVWHELRSPAAEASSYLQTNWNRFAENYHPTYVLDEDPSTAWVEGVQGLGEGQVLTLPLSPVRAARAVRVRVRNGYQKSATLLSANAAPNQVQLRLLDPSGHVTGQVDAALTKTMGWQEVIVPLGGAGFDRLEIEILSAHDGALYEDTCITDVLVDVDSDQPWDPEAERGRFAMAQAWMVERAFAARHHASLPQDFPFTGTQVRVVDVDVSRPEADALLAEQRAALQTLRAIPTWYDRRQTRELEASLDWHYQLSHVLQEFAPENIAWFETDQPSRPMQTNRPSDGWVESEQWFSNDKIEWADDTQRRPRRLHRHVRSVSYGRGTYVENLDYVVSYSAAGRVASVYVATEAEEGMYAGGSSELLARFDHDPEGRVKGWTVTQRHAMPDWTGSEGEQPNKLSTTYQRALYSIAPR